jgi:hypothetical protein
MRSLQLLAILAVAACGAVSSDPDAAVGDDDGTDAMTDADTTDVPTSCTPSTTTCSGQLLTVCDAQGNPTNTTCGFGCAGSGNRCNDLSPSNNLATYLDMAATAQPLVLTGNATIDTTARTVTNGDGSAIVVQNAAVTASPVEIMAISVKSLSAVNVTVRGNRALAILVDEGVTITGNFSASADYNTAGAGALTTANAGTCDGNNGSSSGSNHSGSGGGAHGTAGGGGGGQGTVNGGTGGMVAGDPTNVPLRGGCPGGFTLGPSGAGGGAIQISARGTIAIGAGAFVSAGGGSALGWSSNMNQLCIVGNICDAGGGGGSGGAILLEASAITVDPTGGAVANGGAGHWGRFGRGQNGQLSESPATPYLTPNCPNCPVPGNGAAGATAATNGTGGLNGGNFEGAGGGGGAGRIRINLPAGASFNPGPPIISPNPIIGAVTLR